MVRAMMAEAELVGFAAKREAEDLMTETNSEDRLVPQNAAYGLACVGHSGRVRRPVREKYAIGIQREHFFGGGKRGQHLHAKTGRDEPAKNVALDSVVERDDQRRVAHLRLARMPKAVPQFPIAVFPIVRLAACHFANEILADQPG